MRWERHVQWRFDSSKLRRAGFAFSLARKSMLFVPAGEAFTKSCPDLTPTFARSHLSRSSQLQSSIQRLTGLISTTATMPEASRSNAQPCDAQQDNICISLMIFSSCSAQKSSESLKVVLMPSIHHHCHPPLPANLHHRD